MESGDSYQDSINGDNRANEIPKEEPPPVLPVELIEYKPRSEISTNLNNSENSKENSTMVKQKGENDIDDGAQERMLNDENKITPNKDANEVKFIAENGDVKIDVEAVKQTLSGMSKEELMKYANDPFWVRLRWALFILFWAIWVGMLVGAIVIVVTAPKCISIPKKCWEKSPMVHIDLQNVKIPNVGNVLENLAKKNIYAISLASVLQSDEHGVTNFTDVDTQLGNLTLLQEIIKVGKKNNQCFMLEMDPNYSSSNHPWFKDSISKRGKINYYVWYNGTEANKPPNNWITADDKSLWTKNEQRQQWYYHQSSDENKPDLNYNSTDVVTEMEDVLKIWLQRGFDGFRFGSIKYLTENTTELVSKKQSTELPKDTVIKNTKLQIEYFKDTDRILKGWNNIIKNLTQGQGLCSSQDDRATYVQDADDERLIDLPQHSQWTETMENLNFTIQRILKASAWPAWNFVKKPDSVVEVSLGLKLMTLLLPGTPIFDLNDPIVSENITQKYFEIRTTETFMNGTTEIKLMNETFAYTRIKQGEPAYLVAYNDGTESVVQDFSGFAHISEQFRVVANSSNDGNVDLSFPVKEVTLLSKSTVLFKFAPKF